jgi:hypothetical protein
MKFRPSSKGTVCHWKSRLAEEFQPHLPASRKLGARLPAGNAARCPTTGDWSEVSVRSSSSYYTSASHLLKCPLNFLWTLSNTVHSGRLDGA